MKETSKEQEFKKTQSTSSPGAGGEDVNHKPDKFATTKKDQANKTAQSEGLNEEKSTGNAGAFEGFENTEA